MEILYSLNALFPYGTPIASRTLNICRILHSMGHRVHLFCDYLSEPSICDESKDFAVLEGINIHFSFVQRNFKSQLFKSLHASRKIENFLKKNHVDLIIATTNAERFLMTSKIAARYNIPLLLEICEKYHYSNWSFGRFNPRYYTFLRCWKKEYMKADGVIAISRFLEKHFTEYGKKTIRMPSVLDVSKIPCRLTSTSDNCVRFVFSGGLGNGKDSLAEFMIALNNVKGKLSRKIELNIYGPTKTAVLNQLGKKAYVAHELDDIVCYHGRIPQNEIPLRLLENDFGIILRPQRESSNAGFPTKLAEYMSAGLPVLANDTGDIGLYLNSTNGCLLENKSVKKIEQAVLAIDSMSKEKLSDMRKAARKTAEENFDYHIYAPLLRDFLQNIR
ncbi:glycosyltransferase [Fibrobacter sp. UWB5]|uniref:glycosyltransferase n=1 Tax=Fibrobacter sp. UWB5 TaxID=1964360 RepID=UPI000B5259B2|nr:glycosyltransferase [Fibrobacter sp. UWB5]OWV14369.1 hypothetical protein B7989_02625 [Fibrobacter sp. UWB5]